MIFKTRKKKAKGHEEEKKEIELTEVTPEESANHKHHHHHHHHNENVSGVLLHIIADALGSVGVIISAILIKYYNMIMADPICSIIISILILLSIIPLLKRTVRIMILALPENLEKKSEKIMSEIMCLEGVNDCSELKLWQFKQSELMANVKVDVEKGINGDQVIAQIRTILKNYKVTQSSIQLDLDAGLDIIGIESG